MECDERETLTGSAAKVAALSGGGRDPRAPKKAKQDYSIMETNNSSIVSKRSVERAYHPEPHFFRYFVRKPKRRSPLIDIGYWLRMRAVEVVLRRFLEQPSTCRKVVVNLGCGYDPLPFQALSKYGTLSRETQTHFIDVDYPELIERKSNVIIDTPQLCRLIEPFTVHPVPDRLRLSSDHYSAIACDLEDLDTLNSTLRRQCNPEACLILFIAEVSMTYMETNAADALIGWTASFEQAQFCLIEQLLPDGPKHPFARKMLAHFQKLNSPLKSVNRYPILSDQEVRFRAANYETAYARSLWQVWNDTDFVDASTRLSVLTREPFDEWEDVILFAHHYALVEAWNGRKVERHEDRYGLRGGSTHRDPSHRALLSSFTLQASKVPDPAAFRRHGTLWEMEHGIVAQHGGLGKEGRLDTTNLYQLDDCLSQPKDTISASKTPRLCHTITSFYPKSALLVGGRTSPDNALADCWIFSGNAWRTADTLPKPLYRHGAVNVSVNSSPGVLIFGGRHAREKISEGWYLWSATKGWDLLGTSVVRPAARFSPTLVALSDSQGLLFGGLRADCTICFDLWEWTLVEDVGRPFLVFKDLSGIEDFQKQRELVCRVGACAVRNQSRILISGGVANRVFPPQEDILEVSFDLKMEHFHVQPLFLIQETERMPLVGHSMVKAAHSIAIIGGGVTCFSFGSLWNDHSYILKRVETVELPFTRDGNVGKDAPAIPSHQHLTKAASNSREGVTREHKLLPGTNPEIPRTRITKANEFDLKVQESRPFVLEGLDIGSCVEEWSLHALRTKVGIDREVTVHEGHDQKMSFKEKNFKYVKKPFGQFLDEIASGTHPHQYLRSLALGDEKRNQADLSRDFPELASDFILPASLLSVTNNAHSSPLRISGSVNMWLHYDVMANVLCQIRGARHLRLYPPSDILSLGILAGDSSSKIDVFDETGPQYTSLRDAHPYDAVLEAGDVLFIPPMWAHAAATMTPFSVAVNIFFRSLDSGYATGRDIYGNRDLQSYENGRREVKKMTQSFRVLPPQIRRFYLERLGQELMDAARQTGI